MGISRCLYIQIAIPLLLFITQASVVGALATHGKNMMRCMADERSALLAFRAGLSDPEDLLSSWSAGDCCQWKGVQCSNRTGHVIKLDLGAPYCNYYYLFSTEVLGGNISSSLLGLRHLQYLDLSCNAFNWARIPEFLGSLHKLKHLDLSMLTFFGRIPPQLGNLTNLRYLNLMANTYLSDTIFTPASHHTYSTDITWLSSLTSLEYLDMSSVNLSTIPNWFPVVNMLPLKVLHLSYCQLTSSPDSLDKHSNLTSLEILDLSSNDFNQRITPNWFWDLTSLKHLDIDFSQFSGPFPNNIGNMTSIVVLDLAANYFVGMIPSMNNLCNMEMLFLSSNNINGSITELLKRLPSCAWNKLQSLYLDENNLTGSLPTMLQPLSNLSSLDLSYNKLTGHVPLWIGELMKLETLRLNDNNLDGVMNEGHLSGLERLEDLALSKNSISITVGPTWIPPFSLSLAELGSCQLGPKFPTWFRWQTLLGNLDISNTSISDIVPDWFWRVVSSAESVNIQNNQLRGTLPSTLVFLSVTDMDLSSNQFSGPIPKLPTNLVNLDLSRNNFSGPLPSDFGPPELETLFLFENSISGTIPSSVCKLQRLYSLDISKNKLSGSFPDCSANASTANMTSLSGLNNLSLRNNNLSSKFPSFLQNCENLVFLDLAHNQFFGTLPSWIGENMSSLAFLRLRSNMFYGHIPLELTKLVHLQYLDLSYNNISGIIPRSVVNFTRMTLTRNTDQGLKYVLSSTYTDQDNEMIDYTENLTVVTKGQERLYTGEIIYMVNLDLSCNNLEGEIPEEVGTLVALKSLNLSWNSFGGKINEKIGALVQVESLDLSHNELSGEIPTSLSALTSLSYLNLSYNNLTGKIPSGNQLQTLDDQSIYIGNPGLCGLPLSKTCPEDEPIPAVREHHEGVSEMVLFFLAMGSGYVMGLWVVLCIFLFKRKWRVWWFSFYDSLCDQVYVHVAVSWASLTRNMVRR